MIKCDNDTTTIEGNFTDILSEFELIVVNVYDALIKKYDNEFAAKAYAELFKRFNKVVEDYNKQSEKTFTQIYLKEVIEEFKQRKCDVDDLLDDILKKYFEE